MNRTDDVAEQAGHAPDISDSSRNPLAERRVAVPIEAGTRCHAAGPRGVAGRAHCCRASSRLACDGEELVQARDLEQAAHARLQTTRITSLLYFIARRLSSTIVPTRGIHVAHPTQLDDDLPGSAPASPGTRGVTGRRSQVDFAGDANDGRLGFGLEAHVDFQLLVTHCVSACVSPGESAELLYFRITRRIRHRRRANS